MIVKVSFLHILDANVNPKASNIPEINIKIVTIIVTPQL